MKHPVFFLLLLLLALSSGCRQRRSGLPDISGIKVELSLDRFDRRVQAIDSSRTEQALPELQRTYPELTQVFIRNILGLDSVSAAPGLRRFLHLSQALFDTVNVVFRDTKSLEEEFRNAFRYLKYYFPDYTPPRIYTLVGPVDALAESESGPTPNFLRPGMLGISLQFYLGPEFSIYNDPAFIQAVVPNWRSRRFSREYIIADAMELIIQDLYPDAGRLKPLVEQIVERGKRWYLLDQLLPELPDTVKTGYTGRQLQWCRQHEGGIWSELIRREELQSLNPVVIQNYIGEGPFTQGFSQEDSPGRLGQWIGWQIVKKFASQQKGMSLTDIMQTDPREILETAKYKPK